MESGFSRLFYHDCFSGISETKAMLKDLVETLREFPWLLPAAIPNSLCTDKDHPHSTNAISIANAPAGGAEFSSARFSLS